MDKTNEDLLSIGELAALSGLRWSTLKLYAEKELLPYTQKGFRSRRLFNKEICIGLLERVKEMKAERMTLKEIINKIKEVKQ